MANMNWMQLLNGARRKDQTKSPPPVIFYGTNAGESRTEFERDQDRILFATPFRRLIDKTQVFPYEKKSDTIRRRLTHSLEVSNLCRSVGIDLAFNHTSLFKDCPCPQRNLPSVLAAVGLAHDLGNPPFGHKGEDAIQTWFKRKAAETNGAMFDGLLPAMQQDFILFEGNAQTLRLVTKLQLLNDNFGLNLTYGTLSALMKYTSASDQIDKTRSERKKPGYFQSENKVVGEIQAQTGTGIHRHPLAYVMEACDDAAYSILDAEDAAKKNLVSYADVVAFLRAECESDALTQRVITASDKDHVKFREEFKQDRLSPHELDDISMQMFRVYALANLVPEITRVFVAKHDDMLAGKLTSSLLAGSPAERFCETMKKFDRMFAYRDRDVRGLELMGVQVMHGLLDLLWEAITEHDGAAGGTKKEGTPFANYAFSRISENYRRVFRDDRDGLPLRYRELQLLTDMVSGMTDSYAVDFHHDLRGRRGETHPH